MIIGIDVGGTFTDLVAFDETSGAIRATKVPSTPRTPADAVLAGLAALGMAGTGIRHFIHGTTVATNAILERTGARVGLLTTAGFRDVIEIGRTQRVVEGGMFNPRFVRPRPLVQRARRFEARERLLGDGRVLEPLSEPDVADAAAQLREAGVESVAICFLHAYRNPAHELRARELLRTALPEVFVTLSAQVVPEYREFERFSTTVLNAYVSPLMSRYLAALDKAIAQDYTAPMFTMSSNGGILSSRRAGEFGVLTVLSGPVGGVNGSVAVARAAGFRNLITYDMGGTSTDVCLVEDLTPAVSKENVLAGFPLRLPQVSISTVGAGGGSVAWLDGSELRVGPRSAGADPGPACYGRGGTESTVTDANVVLGRIDAERALGGAIRIDRALAERALHALAKRLGVTDLHHAADGVVRLAVARMTSSIREISVQLGHDPRDFVLVAFGGAGPMHATQVAEELGTGTILVPRYPGNLSALGLLTSDLKQDYVRTHLVPLSALQPTQLAAAFAELESLGRQELGADGVEDSEIYVTRAIDVRYVGQAFELTIPVSEYSSDAIRRDFHDRYRVTYGHATEDEEVQVVNIRLSAYGRVVKPTFRASDRGGGLEEARLKVSSVYFGGRFWETLFYERDRLPAAARIHGPAIVEEAGATTVLAPGWQLDVDALGNLRLRR